MITWSTNLPISYPNIIQKTFFSFHLIYWSQISQSPNLLLTYNTENFILPSPKLLVTWSIQSTNQPISYSNIIQNTLLSCHLIYWSQIYQSSNLLLKYNTENFMMPSPKLLVTWSIQSTNQPISYSNII